MAQVSVSLVGVTVELEDEDESAKALIKIARGTVLDLIDVVERLTEKGDEDASE